MPTEPVHCPSCGAGEFHRHDSATYECNHCHTVFRLLDQPTKLCKCGRLPEAFCVRCGVPLCLFHASEWRRCEPVPPLVEDGTPSTLPAALHWGTFGNLLDRFPDLPKSVLQVIETYRVPVDTHSAMCIKCANDCSVPVVAAWEPHREAWAKDGRACVVCASVSVRRHRRFATCSDHEHLG